MKGSFSNSISTVNEASAIWGDDVLAKTIKEMLTIGPKRAMVMFSEMRMMKHLACLSFLIENKK
jgi:hypothetical protein